VAKRIINLTMPVILEEIDSILESEPYCSQIYLLPLAELRQALIIYTLSNVHCRIREIDRADEDIVSFRSSPSALEEHLQVEAVILQGIQYLLYEAEKLPSLPLSQSSILCA
jgi:hypothetical protein